MKDYEARNEAAHPRGKQADRKLLHATYRSGKKQHRPAQSEKKAITRRKTWWLDPGSNRGHTDFQSVALPTELSSHNRRIFQCQRAGHYAQNNPTGKPIPLYPHRPALRPTHAGRTISSAQTLCPHTFTKPFPRKKARNPSALRSCKR